MRATTAIILAAQGLLIGAATMMGLWAGMAWPGAVGLCVVAVGVGCATVAGAASRELVARAGAIVAWAGTLMVAAAVLSAKGVQVTLTSYFDGYYLALAWIIAAAILPATGIGSGRTSRARWRSLAIVWAMLGGIAWVGAAYVHNRSGAFFPGLLILLSLLVLCHFWVRPSAPVIVMVNTLILLILSIPLTDLVVRCTDPLRGVPDAHKRYYLYSVAQEHPVAFGRWWNYYVARWREVERRIYARDPDPDLTYRLRPNSHAQLIRSLFSINSRGFRGPEIPARKGDAYRIVALGASTTFGITLNAGDLPWPRRLQRLIQDRLKPRRPVEVINAGVPGYRLDQSIHRFATDILPLRPDLVISYHGINGFGMLRGAVPRVKGAAPPRYKDRPLRLLADFEYRLKLFAFDHRRLPKHTLRPSVLTDPLATTYARLYRKLIQITETNHIRLALATFSMAVNTHSDPAVVEFYQAGYPQAPWQVQANLVHSTIVQQLARQYPEVCFVDTHPHLDGEHDKFIDLVHFAPAGDAQMAETFYAALKPVLEEDLSRL